MARRVEIGVVYLTGLVQGVSLVTVPAASAIFTSQEFFHLTRREYGSLFLPMAVCAMFSSGLGVRLARPWGLRQIFMTGLSFNLVSMIVLALSQRFVGQHATAYGILLGAMAALGIGFGATLMTLNSYAAGFFRGKSESALTALHALLGTGTALAPLLVALFVHVGIWWLLPLAVGGGFLALMGASLGQPFQAPYARNGPRDPRMDARRHGLPARLWVYASIAILYGVSETFLGNWAPIYLHEDQGLPLNWANFALSAFWAMVTLGRVGIAILSVWVPARWIYLTLPILMVTAFLIIPRIGGEGASVVTFGFAGLACSAFLPLTISFAQREFSQMVEVVSGGLMAAYLFGYGIGSFGVAPLREIGHLALSSIYTSSSALAAGMAVLVIFVTRSRTA